MIGIDGKEAILFRLLVAFFGEDRVVPHMSLIAVCGGSLPDSLDISSSADGTSGRVFDLARASKCLFTIVNRQDDPRMVIEFGADFDRAIDVRALERHRLMRPLLEAAGVPFVTVSQEEFSELTRPESEHGLLEFLKSKFEYSDSGL